MPIYITSRKFTTKLGSFDTLDDLNACVGQDVTCTIEFYFENVNQATSNNAIVLAPTSKDTLDTNNVIFVQNPIFFQDLRIGDVLSCTLSGLGSAFNVTVVDLIGTNIIKTNHDFSGSANTILTSNSFLINKTKRKGILFYYNFIDSGTSFNTLFDGEQCKLVADDVDCADTVTEHTMSFVGKKTNQIGSATIVGDGYLSNGQQKFILTHNTIVTPIFIANQYNDFLISKSPSYLESGNTLTYIHKIDLGINLAFKKVHSLLTSTPKSNIGWFNENFNGGLSNYYVSSLVFTNNDDSSSLNDIELNAETKIEITLKCNDASFSNGLEPTIAKFGFVYLPENESLYKGNNRLFQENFQLDRKACVCDDGLYTGDYNGTDKQIIKELELQYIDSSTVKLIVYIKFGDDAKAIITQDDFMRYAIFCIIENNALDIEYLDTVNLLCHVGVIEKQLATTDIINADTVFITHPYDSASFGQDTITLMPVDDVVCDTTFNIDFNGLQNDNVKIISITPSLVLTHATESDVVLESFTINTQNYETINYDYTGGGKIAIQNINYVQNRGYKIPNEIRRNIVVSRVVDRDNDDQYFWALNFPFMQRWEHWEQLILAEKSSYFFDNTLPFDGFNNKWSRLINTSGWTYNYRLTFNVSIRGTLYEQIFDTELTAVDFSANSDWGNNSIKSYDKTTDSPLNNGSDWFIKGYEDTKIVSSFEKVAGDIPLLSDVVIVMWIGVFESGGIKSVTRCSSEYDNDEQSLFKSNKVIVTSPSSGVFKGTAYLDSTKIPVNTKYTIYSRLYVKDVEEDVFRITNDEEIRLLMNGDIRLVL